MYKIYIYIYVYIYVYLSIYLSIYLPIYLSIYLSNQACFPLYDLYLKQFLIFQI